MKASYYPAIKSNMGDWTYYSASIVMADAVQYFKYAHELEPFDSLDKLIQRELSERTKSISSYLQNNKQRFFGSLIVAVYGGAPNFSPIEFEAGAVLRHLKDRLGVLTFDGDEQYYVLDGQHRLAAMKTLAIEQADASALADEISVILVAHQKDDEGICRARRLFTNLNRYAAKTSKTVNIALDEDDAYSILTRLLLREVPYLRKLTKVLKKAERSEPSLATGESLHPTADSNYLLTITTLYECNKALLGIEAPLSFTAKQLRPPDSDLETGRDLLIERWDAMFRNINFLSSLQKEHEVDLSKDREAEGGEVLCRPVGIKTFCMGVGAALNTQTEIKWENIAKVYEKFNRMENLPWVDLLWRRDGKMLFGKDRIAVAADLWKYLLNLKVNHTEIEKKWLALVDPDRTHSLSLKSLER